MLTFRLVTFICVASFLTVFLVFNMFVFPSAFAAGFMDAEFHSKTYVLLKEDPQGHNYRVGYEYMDFELKNVMKDTMSFHSSGWIRHHFDEIPEYREEIDRTEESLTYAYFSSRPLKDHNLQFNIGRQLLFTSLKHEYIDGISADWEIGEHNGIFTYYGLPASQEIDKQNLDSIYGGRLYQRIKKYAEINISYHVENTNHHQNREEAGFDIWFGPINLFEIQGKTNFNINTDHWMHHSYNLNFYPLDGVILSGYYSHLSYKDFFALDSLGIFSPDYLGKYRGMDKIGGTLEYELSDNTLFALDYTSYLYEESEDARRYGYRGETDLLSGFKVGVAMHRMDGGTEKRRYTESRLYAVKEFKKTVISLDNLYLYYDKNLAGNNHAYSLNTNMSYLYTDQLSASINIEYLKDQNFTDSISLFFTLEYSYE